MPRISLSERPGYGLVHLIATAPRRGADGRCQLRRSDPHGLDPALDDACREAAPARVDGDDDSPVPRGHEDRDAIGRHDADSEPRHPRDDRVGLDGAASFRQPTPHPSPQRLCTHGADPVDLT